MKILQSGYPKSGNYWLYTIIRQLINKSDTEYTSYIKKQPIYNIAKNWNLSVHNQPEIDVLDITPQRIVNRIGRIYQMPLEDFDNYLNQSTLTWTHLRFYKECIDIYNKFDKIVYIVRDPRSVAISSAKFQNTEYSKLYLGSIGKDPQLYMDDNFEVILKSWAISVMSLLEILQRLNVYIIFYENLRQNPKEEIESLAEYLNITVSENKLEEIVDEVSLKSMQEKDSKHVRKGELYEWKYKLSKYQKWKADTIVGPLLRMFNYPNRRSKYSSEITLKKTPSIKKLKRIKYWIHLTMAVTTGYKIAIRKIVKF